ncbi:MAG: exodeoxyribonuclease V beta subunit, partial [Myxococcota bacterium]
EQHHYYLQYHLYTLALHRYLRWRIPDYDYDTHIGGVYYLFFRGMVGPETPSDGGTVGGSFFDRPPADVIHALDAAFDAKETP